MRDEIISIKKNNKDGDYILNLDDSSNSGTHWVCFRLQDTGCLYFDSYGKLPPDEMIEMAKRFNINLNCSDIQYQPNNSITCGYYCVYWLRHDFDTKKMVVTDDGSIINDELVIDDIVNKY